VVSAAVIGRPVVIRGLLFLFLASTIPAHAQKADKLSQVKTLYVESLGHNRRAEDIRTHLVRRIKRDHAMQIIADPANADAVLKGTGQIWSTGIVSLSPHSHSANEPILEGYLSVEVVGKNDQTLWSYLAMPSRFPLGGIADDLARQVASRLTDDVRKDSQQHEPAASGETASAGASLKGAGATFPAPIYRKWFQSFQELHPDANITYDAVGSGEGIRRVTQAQVDFGASDMPLTDQEMSQAHRRFVQVPVVLGAVVPIYNLPKLHHRIRFTPEILAGIYLGKIKRWNDPQIAAANPEAALPDTEIVVVHRSDASGTSFVWTDYLSKVSAEWRSSVGAGISVQYPVGIGAAYNDGVAATVEETPNSIGYVEFIYAIQHELSFAAVKNAAGVFIKADLASVTEAARTSASSDGGLRLSITNAPGKSAYPIASYTWLLLPEQFEDKNKKALLLDLLRWILSSGQKSCSALGYAPLPTDVATRALQSVERDLQDHSGP
jgi:phosphate transport system substrate-binding protein